MSTPARGYSWAPFEPGHTLSLRHGARSPRTVQAKVDELEPTFAAWLDEHAPWAAAPVFELSRINTLRNRAIVDLLVTSIFETAEAKGADAVPLKRFEMCLSALRSEREALRDLGLTPQTSAQLASTVTDTEASLARLTATGAAIMERRPAQQDGPDELESATTAELVE